MKKLLVEIKARCVDPDRIRQILLDKKADSKGTDRQIDTYFNVPDGRLKLRQGNIEHSLIHYKRNNQAGPKDSHVTLARFAENAPELKQVLLASLGELVEVDKSREIYFIENVKFHIDQVIDLGSFVEIEAIGTPGVDKQETLLAQCQHYMELFSIATEDLVEVSYSDLLMELQEKA